MGTQNYVLAYDFGTGGCKSSLYDQNGHCLSEFFSGYKTFYPKEGFHEQKPADWWQAVKGSTISLLKNLSPKVISSIKGIGISGHSLGMIPLDENNQSLLEAVPIWSDSRPGQSELKSFFSEISEEEWYKLTGNGFPAPLYTVFKILWLKNHRPDVFEQTSVVVGTKDYINGLLTGVFVTDFSYASGSGIYDLEKWQYSEQLVAASGLPCDIFPEIVGSSDVIGTLLPDVASELGLPKGIQVVAGGVDNSCMALGARCTTSGRVYNSLGSSSWIAVSSRNPILETQYRPYVFTHVVPELFVSATAIFSAGSCYRWFREQLAPDMNYEQLNQLAEAVSPGCQNLIFNPTLAGGSSIDKSPNAKGGFLGLTLSHTRGHMARAVLEGVALSLRVALDVLKKDVELGDDMLIVGGGSKGQLWRRILANAFELNMVKTSVNEQAAALGAAALTLVGCGIWHDFSPIDELHKIETIDQPDPETAAAYTRLLPLFNDTADYLADFGDRLQTVSQTEK